MIPILNLITEAFLGKVKTVLIIVSTIIAIFASVYGVIFKMKYDKAEYARLNLELRNTVLTTENITYQNDLGQTVTVTTQYERTIDELAASNDSLEKALYIKLTSSNIKMKDAKEATMVEVKVKGSGIVDRDTIFVHDTLETDTIPVIEYSDGYLDLSIVGDTINYTYDDSITIFKSNERVPREFFLWKLLGLKKRTGKNRVEVVMENPNSKTKVRTIEIRNK